MHLISIINYHCTIYDVITYLRIFNVAKKMCLEKLFIINIFNISNFSKLYNSHCIILNFQYFPWKNRFVYSLSSRLLPKLQSYPAVVLFIEGDQEEELELAEGVLLPVAQQVAKTKTNALYDLLFFIAPDVRKYVYIHAHLY